MNLNIKSCKRFWDSLLLAGVFLLSFLTSCRKDEIKGPIPVVETTGLTGITANSALAEGTIIKTGGLKIITSGVCWGPHGNVTIDDNRTTDGTWSGKFTSKVTGLLPEQVYYVRAYATNSNGTGYGHAVPFTTEKGLIDIEGNVYNIVTIGTQVWMAENLKTTKFNDGREIILEKDNYGWSLRVTPAYAWYENDPVAYKYPYGALYNWHTVNTGKLCPAGWHVPSNDEWRTLILFLGRTAGGILKEQGTSHWISPNKGATDEYGFTGLPGGRRLKQGFFASLGEMGNYWSANFIGEGTAWSVILEANTDVMYLMSIDKKTGFSVRCLKD